MGAATMPLLHKEKKLNKYDLYRSRQLFTSYETRHIVSNNGEHDVSVNRWSTAMNEMTNYLIKRALIVLVGLSALISGSMVYAQNAANGKTLYCAPIIATVVKCADGGCHGPSVATNQNKIKNGANNPAASTGKGISFGIATVTEMRPLSVLTATQLADLGAFIAAPSICTTATAPGASVSPATLTYASTNVGATAATQTTTLTNSGTAALAITSTAISGDFTITANTCTAGASIAAGSNCSVTASFTPTAAGARTGAITITHNASPATSTVSLSGTGVAVVVGTPAASLSSSALSFASTNVGATSSTQSVTLTNSGTAALVLGATTITGNFAISSSTCTSGASIAAGSNCVISISFSPASAGALSGTLTVAHNATPSSSMVALSGTGVAVVVGTPTASLSTTALSYASTTVGATTSLSVTLTNSGTAALVLGATTISGADFSIASNTCTSGASIAPTSSCAVSVAFTPTAAGARSGSLTISHNASPATSTVSLAGTGVAVVVGAPSASLSSTALSYASTTVGASTALSFTLTNSGTAALVLGATAVIGTDFSIASNTCASGSSVAPSATCTVSVNFTPTAAGARSGSVTISHNASPATNTVSLAGTGVAVVVGAPSASLSSTALSFASTTVGATASPQTITLTNTGTVALILGATWITGAEFSVVSNTCSVGISVAPNANCTLSVNFIPTAAGARSGSVTINHNASPATSVVALTGTGAAVVVTAPAATLSSAALTFASATVGSVATAQTVSLTNSGTAPLLLGATTVSNADFTIVSTTCTAGVSVAPAASCTLSISFTPSAAGARSGTVTINHNATPAASLVTLSGTGVTVTVGAPAASLSSTALSFASTNVATTASAQSVTLTNTGTVPLVLGTTTVTGAEFTVISNTCTAGLSLAASGTCLLSVGFTPSAAGARTGLITISHNASPSTSTISLSGTGVIAPAGTPVVSVSSSAVAFAGTMVGAWAPSQTVTLTNTGTSTLNIASFTLASTEFSTSISSCNAGAILAPGANCTLTLQFKPSATGMRSATITIAHNASPAVSSIALTGTGLLPANAAPIADFNGTAITLPATGIGAVSPGLSLTLTNTGNAPLVLADFFVLGDPPSPAEFTIAATNCVAGAALAPLAHCTLIVTFTPTLVGTRSGTLNFSHNASPAVTSITVTGTGAAAPTQEAATRVMVEYLYTPLNYYFMTSRDAEKTALDAIADFRRTGASFFVYASQQGSTRAITRFYFDEVRAGQHSSHFYTLLNDDLLLLADQNPTRSTAPNMAQNEGVDSFAVSPLVSGVGGRCAADLLPVYRMFRGNSRFPNDPNHRFTTDLSAYNAAVAAGWDGEGVNFCVPAQ